MTSGPKQLAPKVHRWNLNERKVPAQAAGKLHFGTFKARQVPKSLYERPSKKKQAQGLKSASRSVSSEEEEYAPTESPFSGRSLGGKENYSANPQIS